MSAEIGQSDAFKFYRYEPSIATACVAIAAFGITTTIHTIQVYRSRNWICICLAVGGLNETLSYILRILSAKETPNHTIGLFVATSLPSLLAPAIFAACVYVSLGRIIQSVDAAKYSVIRLSILTKFFVAGDVLGLAIQGAGGTLMPMDGLNSYTIGSNLVIAGLAVLVFYFALFLVVGAVFHLRISRRPTPQSLVEPKEWLHDLRVLYITSAFIFIRSIFRLIEYAGGNNGWLMRHEWTLYVFDAILMWLVLVLFNIWPPPPKGGRELVSDCEGGHESGGGDFSLRKLRGRSHSGTRKTETLAKVGVAQTLSAK